ncbi:MAG: mechanosensitive ion channel family protein [Thermodesulfobacteriota bacterium]
MILNKVVYANVTLLDLLIVGIILVVALSAAKGLSIYLRRFLKEKLSKEHIEIIVRLVDYSIVAVAVLMVLPMLGLNLSGLLVAGGIAGLAIGFASQSIVGNMISGLFLIVERPIKIGNSVDIDGTAGIVEDIRIMSTTLRTFDGLFVRIPNQKVFTANITNFVANIARRFEYIIGIRYSDDADKAIGLIRKLISDHPLTLVSPEPQVFVDSLGDNSVNIIVRIWAPTSDWFSVKAELLWKIKQALEKEGIEIPFPQRVVWLANDPGKTEIPAPHL